MGSSTKHQLAQLLYKRVPQISDALYEAIAKTSYVSYKPARVRKMLAALTEKAIDVLLAETFNLKQAQSVGEMLAQFEYLQPEALGSTQEVLGTQVIAGLSPEQALALHPRLMALLGGLATGYFIHARQVILTAQEQLRVAIETAQRDAEAALVASERKFQLLAELVSAAIFIYQDDQLEYVNRTFLESTGYTIAELQSMSYWDIVHPDYRDLVKAFGAARRRSEHATSLYEVMVRRKDGTYIWVEVSFGTVLFNGKPAVLGTAFDITERKQAELVREQLLARAEQEIEERKLAEQKVRQSEARHKALLNAIPDLLFRLDRDGVILDYYAGAPEDLYAEPEEFLGKRFRDVLPLEVSTLIKTHLDNIFNTGRMQVFEYELIMPVGPQFFEMHLVLSTESEALALVRNITGRKHMEQQAVRTERLTALGRLSATLAHEMNNPLQAIQTHLDLLLDFPLPSEDRERYLKIIRQEVRRISAISQRTLNFASPQPKPRHLVSITEVLRETILLVRKKLEHRQIQITTDFSTTALVMAAPDQLHQVFLNLILNAIQAMSDAVPALLNGELNITTYCEAGKVTIVFTNNGPIIPVKVMTHIFEPFYTTKKDGTGLGLWTSYNLVEQHGGILTVNNLGRKYGVAFTVRLPIYASANDTEYLQD